MKDFKLNFSSLGYFIQEITKLIHSDQLKNYRVNIVEWREKRSLSQNAFQHVIYSEISKYLISKGRTDWSEEKVKFEMKNNFLGWKKRECTNVLTGDVIVKEVLISTTSLDVGESCDYTTKILDFSQSIGCTIKIPVNCDYRDYIEMQDK